MRTMISSLLKSGITVLALTAFFGTNAAFAQTVDDTEIDRVRCKVDLLVDDLGNPFNHVQIQVKVDTTAQDPLPIDVWVTNDIMPTPDASEVATVPFIDGTATGEWDSSPDGIDLAVLWIDPEFAEPDENITASINVSGAAAITVACRLKTGGVFRQDTKPCKQKDFDRGRCSPVTEP